jgi:hypothetical protein
MDRNTVIGLVLIGLILSVFTIFNQPSEEEIKQRRRKQKKLLRKRRLRLLINLMSPRNWLLLYSLS